MPREFSTLLVERRPDRVQVQLNRPDVRNAIDQAMVDELHLLCSELERGPRILILCGAAGVFASGADIAQLRERRRDDALTGINSELFERIARLPMPVIAAIDGWALGGGAELAYAADFRIASETARLGNPETSLGIIPAAGALWRLAELVGEPVAKEIILAGRILTAEEALAVRLVTEVHPAERLLAAAHSLADRIAAQDPLATQLAKEVFHVPRARHPRADNEAQAVLFESEEKFARMTAFLERKKR
ncbi:enoyl-CoA hydratase/isomerase family protein [Cryobacterium sp. HLT2-28]|uniref:enoyl-CoA hydratase/isomerase family protein n=1 Tax=Cryobacterium sp. HLT2-28 TaxID=1259146 RepID=UPI00106B7573|nr:enoyl-CoA hydratase/isomerase family protein [Cryobacterium sp. HLT2-28]TFB92463.1 enoyl-CoA hydratase/isomerase family protein [Cryobacterium sp. HLT2-28]